MPHAPAILGKRAHDGSDVRAYPVTGGPHKKVDPHDFPQKLKSDEATSLVPLQLPPGSLAASGTSASLGLSPTRSPTANRFSVCIVGAGAIGCHLAYVLQKAGNDVTLIARGANLKVIQNEGLHMTICGEEIGRVRMRATDNPEEVGQVDYVFLTMKVSGYDTKVVDLIRPLVGEHTTILPPTTSIPYWWFHQFGGKFENCRLNRVDPGGALWDMLPPQKVIGFTMWLSAVQEGPGKVVLRHVQRGYPVGELDGSRSERVDRLADALERGGIPAPRVPCIRSEIFIKSLNSLAFNVVAVLGDAQNGTIADVPEAVSTLLTVMRECEAVAEVLGINIAQSAEGRVTQTLSARMHTMSMLHDLRVGKPLELRPLWTSFKDLAELVGVPLPITRALVGVALLRETAEQRRRTEAADAAPAALCTGAASPKSFRASTKALKELSPEKPAGATC